MVYCIRFGTIEEINMILAWFYVFKSTITGLLIYLNRTFCSIITKTRLILVSIYLKLFDGSTLTTEKTGILSMEYESFQNLADFLSPSILFLSLTMLPLKETASSSLNKPGCFFSKCFSHPAVTAWEALPSWSYLLVSTCWFRL